MRRKKCKGRLISGAGWPFQRRWAGGTATKGGLLLRDWGGQSQPQTRLLFTIRNAISTLSLLFVAAENGAVDVCRYLLARLRFSSFFSQEFHNDLDLYSSSSSQESVCATQAWCRGWRARQQRVQPTFYSCAVSVLIFFTLFTAAQWA